MDCYDPAVQLFEYSFRLLLTIVAEPAEQIAKTLQYAKQNHRSVTFRASGSSLNGQSQGDDILIDVRNCFNGLEILQEGLYARIKPGTIISTANRALLPYNRVLGPDPASSGVATIGGVVANNASGMTAGTKLNSYQTTRRFGGSPLNSPTGLSIRSRAPAAPSQEIAACSVRNSLAWRRMMKLGR